MTKEVIMRTSKSGYKRLDVFVMLKTIRNAKILKAFLILRTFRSNVKSVLLYGDEAWHLTMQDS